MRNFYEFCVFLEAADSYEQLDPGHSFERVVCADADPGLDRTGMPLGMEMTNLDRELEGYFGTYAGDWEEWLPILIDDNYCEAKNAYVYEITIPEQPEFYWVEDPNTGGWSLDGITGDSRETPSAHIIFARTDKIPPDAVTLKRVVDVKKFSRQRDEDAEQEAKWSMS